MTPFRQKIHAGESGADVLAVKRALLKMKAQDAQMLSVKGPRARVAGKAFVHCIKALQHNHGWTESGIYGGRVHAVVAPHFDLWGVTLYRSAAIRHPAVSTAQERILDYVRWAMSNRELIGYGQHRPMHDATRHLPMNIDCSEFATLTFKDAGCPDPNGFHYNGSGNTTSLRQHGERVVGEVQVGDMAFYDHPDHVGIYVHKGVVGRAQVAEHGSDPGPLYEPDNYRRIVEVRRYELGK